MTINEFCSRFASGEFDSYSHLKQLEAGWFDWWCRDTALPRKTAFLGGKVARIQKSKRFDADKTYVFFKNNCPMVGKLYDQFSICDLATGDVLFCAQYLEKGSHGCEHAHWELYDRNVGFGDPVVNGTWRDVEKYFMN